MIKSSSLKQINRVREAGFALGSNTGEKVIRAIFLRFHYEDGKKTPYPDFELINNNPWAVTHFLKKYSTKYYTDEERAFLKDFDTKKVSKKGNKR